MVQLPPSEFTFGRYGGVSLPWDTIKSLDNYLKWLLSQDIVGYCDSLEVGIRPRSDSMAVMFQGDDGWQSWVHVPMDVWKGFVEKFNS